MKKIYIVFLIFFGYNSLVAQNNSDDLFKRANSYYQEEKYTQAIDNYLKIIDLGYESGELYFNLGNAYYKLGKVAQSIYYYEKAQILSPLDLEIQSNKKITQQMTLDNITPLPKIGIEWVKQFSIDNFSIKLITVLAFVGAWTLAIFILLYYFSKRVLFKKIFFTTSAFCFLFLFGIITFGFFIENAKNIQTAILFENGVKMYSEPSEHSSELLSLNQGTKIEIQENFSSWTKIRLANGQTGWVKQHTYKKL